MKSYRTAYLSYSIHRSAFNLCYFSTYARPPTKTLTSHRPVLPSFRRASYSTWPDVSEFKFHDTNDEPRFDWRLWRKTMPKRLRTPEGLPTHQYPRRKYIKRIEPPLLPVEIGRTEFFEEISLYSEHFMPLLKAEQEECEAVFLERLSSWSHEKLQEEGYCITGLSAYWRDRKGRFAAKHVACIWLGAGIELPPNSFEDGSRVLVSRLNPLKEVPFKGIVRGQSATQLEVEFQEWFAIHDGVWRLDVGYSDIIFERMRTAISHLNHDPAAQERYVAAHDRQFYLQGTHLRDVILRSFTPNREHSHSEPLQLPDEVGYVDHGTLEHTGRLNGDSGGAFKDDMRIRSWALRYMRPNPVRVEGDPPLDGLNATQIRAMATMIGERLSLIQGPPGTGKTKTIIETIKLLKGHFQVVHPILVCTYTNVAVDNLVEGLVSSGLDPLRIGSAKVKRSLTAYTLDHKISEHPLFPEHLELVAASEEVQRRMRSLREDINNLVVKNQQLSTSFAKMETHLEHLEAQAQIQGAKSYRLRQEMHYDVVSNADVICTTCISSVSFSLNVVDFPVVFLDEASMSTEPASLIPIMKGSRHLALIGDHKQLPPVITSRVAQEKGLGISLFERLTEEGDVPSVMLDIQYRMHPDISSFPSLEFYNKSLLDGTVDDEGNISSSLTPPKSSHLEVNAETGRRPSVIFLDHTGKESARSRSHINWDEANIVCSVVEDLLLHNEHILGKDIGIIAPYVAQINLLTRLFNKNEKYRARFERVLGVGRAMQLEQIEIKTVDGFEGREKEIIIFSTVRNNPHGYIGFLSDRRRLNVGLTRAKRGLFVVGSISTLTAGKSGDGGGMSHISKGAGVWKRYAEYLSHSGLIRELSGDRLKRTLYENYNKSSRLKT